MTETVDLTDAQIASMSEDELEAWYDAHSIGPWEPVENVPSAPPRVMISITVRMPRELLAELKAEAAKHRQPYQRYMKDLLHLALRQVQAAGRDPKPAQVRLTEDQLRELNERGELTVQLRRAGAYRRPSSDRRA